MREKGTAEEGRETNDRSWQLPSRHASAVIVGLHSVMIAMTPLVLWSSRGFLCSQSTGSPDLVAGVFGLSCMLPMPGCLGLCIAERIKT